MKSKILKGFLIGVCQLILLTGVSFAYGGNESNLGSFNEVIAPMLDEFQGKIEKKYLDELEDTYEEVYQLEKEMKCTDAKWDDVIDVLEEICEELEDDEKCDDDALERLEDNIRELEDLDFSSTKASTQEKTTLNVTSGLPGFDNVWTVPNMGEINNADYFKLGTFEEEILPLFEDFNIKGKFVNDLKAAYDEAYQLEKEMKYFTADGKWNEVMDLLEDIYEMIEDKEDDYDREDIEELEDAIWELDLTSKRDYRYGLPNFDEAYNLELKQYIDLIPEDNREAFKETIKTDYNKMQNSFTKIISTMSKSNIYNENYKEYRKIVNEFCEKRQAVNGWIRSITNQQYLVFTQNDVYNIKLLDSDTEKLKKFLNEKEALNIIGKDGVKKLKRLCEDLKACDSDVEKDDVLDEIEELLYSYFKNGSTYYKGENSENARIINELYDEIRNK